MSTDYSIHSGTIFEYTSSSVSLWKPANRSIPYPAPPPPTVLSPVHAASDGHLRLHGPLLVERDRRRHLTMSVDRLSISYRLIIDRLSNILHQLFLPDHFGYGRFE